MAGGQERALRRRIRSVQATKKITKAMELIAASQIVRAQNRMAANRPYRAGMSRVVLEAALGDPRVGSLLGTPESVTRVGVLAVVADRGLCGAYNSTVLRTTERLMAELRRQGVEVTLFTVGKKAQSYFRFRGEEVARSFVGVSERPTFDDARQVAHYTTAPFLAGEMDQLMMVSTRVVSGVGQEVLTEQLLPLPDPRVGAGEDSETASPPQGVQHQQGYTEFEPEVHGLLEALAPKAVESEIFSALLEGAAAFFTAQQRAMAAASDNADELIRTLSRIMNRARQDAITTEIMEIVGGAEALRHSKGA